VLASDHSAHSIPIQHPGRPSLLVTLPLSSSFVAIGGRWSISQRVALDACGCDTFTALPRTPTFSC
jgi:hypothetical protein